MYTIATLYRLRQRLGLESAAEEPRLLAALSAASAQLERLAGRRFVPRYATLEHNLPDLRVVLLDDDLLELTALEDVDPADVIARPDSGLDGVISVLERRGGLPFPADHLLVSGIWGYHDRWSQAWRGSGDTVQANPLSDSSDTLIVADAAGSDADGESPRFQAGQLIRIEGEYLWVLAVDTETDTLTVQRGANGSTAASHAQGSAIHVYRPALDVEMLCLRWAAWLYKEPDQRGFASLPAALSGAVGELRRLMVKA